MLKKKEWVGLHILSVLRVYEQRIPLYHNVNVSQSITKLPPRRVGQGGWEGDARRNRYGDICICIADSLCYKVETNTPL